MSMAALTKPASGSSNQKLFEKLAKELVSLALGGLMTYFIAKKLFEQIDPQKREKDAARVSKAAVSERLERDIGPTNEWEDVVCADVVNPRSIATSFDSIGGLEDVKAQLQDLIIYPLRNPEVFAGSRLLRQPKGILLYGPPGTGKTMLARAIAKESGAVFINVSQSTVQNKWFGESVKLIHAVFTLAVKLQPSVIFIDEIDSFLRERSSSDHQCNADMKCEFMTLWDGMGTDDRSQVVVLGASNRPWDIDEAIQRRLPRSFEVGLPTQQQRENILLKILAGETCEGGFWQDGLPQLARLTDGYSGSDLHELCNAAAFGPVRDHREGHLGPNGGVRGLRLSDFEDELRKGNTRTAASEFQDKRESRGRAGGVDVEELAALMKAMMGAGIGGAGGADRQWGQEDTSPDDTGIDETYD